MRTTRWALNATVGGSAQRRAPCRRYRSVQLLLRDCCCVDMRRAGRPATRGSSGEKKSAHGSHCLRSHCARRADHLLAADCPSGCPLHPDAAHHSSGHRAGLASDLLVAGGRAIGPPALAVSGQEACRVSLGQGTAHRRAGGGERSQRGLERHMSIMQRPARDRCSVLFCLRAQGSRRCASRGTRLSTLPRDQSCRWAILLTLRSATSPPSRVSRRQVGPVHRTVRR